MKHCGEGGQCALRRLKWHTRMQGYAEYDKTSNGTHTTER